jgi:hypothetical protein
MFAGAVKTVFAAGDVMLAVGAVLTTMLTALEVVTALLLSVARAV